MAALEPRTELLAEHKGKYPLGPCSFHGQPSAAYVGTGVGGYAEDGGSHLSLERERARGAERCGAPERDRCGAVGVGGGHNIWLNLHRWAAWSAVRTADTRIRFLGRSNDIWPGSRVGRLR
ncbi:Hypothetical protein NTJ_08067 [Nesidiocoris tenuis]|uniref:Uncharacterized protein n=1 Tax=Nesidiocoris tenuis TaxID=355587 RepID=A0ABN7ATI0_9HEMI|nr:Hypothetical protein NTJ_08067 [Nesidiocoris tenuis]